VGRRLRGTVKRTLVRGRTVYRDGAIVGEPAGEYVRPDVAASVVR
jgi:allantoinase